MPAFGRRRAPWLALLPLLLAAVWLLHLAAHLQGGGEDEEGPATEVCQVCLHLASQGAPLPPTNPPLAAPPASPVPPSASTSIRRHSPAPLPRQGAPPRV